MAPQFNYLPLSLAKLFIRNQFKNAWLTRPYDKEFKDDRANLNEWTLSFIPTSKFICEKLVDLCDHYTTQIVTRHGENMQYLSEFGIADNNKCVLHPNETDTPEHILFNCNSNYSRALKRMGITSKNDLHRILTKDNYIRWFKELCKTIAIDRKELNQKSLCEMKDKKLALKLVKDNKKLTPENGLQQKNRIRTTGWNSNTTTAKEPDRALGGSAKPLLPKNRKLDRVQDFVHRRKQATLRRGPSK